MLCKNPFVRDPTGKVLKYFWLVNTQPELLLNGVPFPCGQCLPCRINKRRLWTHRLLLESYFHSDSVFVTLTYADEYLPPNGSLDKKALQKFLKRLRYFLRGREIRYYAVGEYGGQTHRPHYHCIIYGLALLESEVVARAWPFGRVHVAECNRHTIGYVAGYVTKKFVKNGDDLVKEFAIMSRKPGLGYKAIETFVELLQKPEYKHLFGDFEHVPTGLRHGNTFLPFDRYIKDKLSKLLEYDADATEYIRETCQKYFQSLHTHPTYTPLLDCLADEAQGKQIQIERRFRIFNTNLRSKI